MILSHHVLVRGKVNKAVLLFVKIKRELARLPGRAPFRDAVSVRTLEASPRFPLTIKKVALSDDLFYCGE